MKKAPAELPAKRCQNCPKIFRPKQPTQRFCSAHCRMEFHRFGAAYGPLRDKLEKLVAQLIETKYHALDNRLKLCSEGLGQLVGHTVALESTAEKFEDRLVKLEQFVNRNMPITSKFL